MKDLWVVCLAQLRSYLLIPLRVKIEKPKQGERL